MQNLQLNLSSNAQFSDLAYLGYKKDFPIFGFFGLVGKFLTWEWAVVK